MKGSHLPIDHPLFFVLYAMGFCLHNDILYVRLMDLGKHGTGIDKLRTVPPTRLRPPRRYGVDRQPVDGGPLTWNVMDRNTCRVLDNVPERSLARLRARELNGRPPRPAHPQRAGIICEVFR
jgi:hypothetical protein